MAAVSSAAPPVFWTKRIFDTATDSDFAAALDLEEIGNVACFRSTERVRAVNAFFARDHAAV